MNPVFLIGGKTLCIRRLKQTDLQHAYYDLMSLLSEIDRTILRTREILDNLKNEYIYFVIEDLNTNMIIGTGTVIISNNSIQLSQVGHIENIMICQDYHDIGLGDIIFQHLKYYCVNTKHCIKVITNCDHNI